MEVDWDLHAVVRGCAASSSTTAATATDSTAPPNGHDQLFSSTSSQQQDYCSFSSAAAASTFQDLFDPRKERPVEELHDLYKPFVVNRQLSSSQESSSQVLLSPGNIPISPLSVLGGLQDPPSELQQQQQVIIKSLPPQQNQLLQKQQQQQQQLFSIGSSNHSSKAGASHNPSNRSKKRKNHLKKVCHVAAENLSSDIWSWRKYGQKPIKGSPYPRGYYKCSTSKGCMARKQVERNRSDPGMFIVTYTAEHNHPMPTHRSSLAGSTRQKPDDTPNSDEPKNITTSLEMSPAATLSPVLEKLDSSRDDLVEPEDDDDDSISASNMAMEDDFFAGLDDFGPGLDGGKSISDQFPADLLLPWVSDGATAAAAGSG